MSGFHKNLAVGSSWRTLRSLFGEDLSPLGASSPPASSPSLASLGLSSLSYVDADTLSLNDQKSKAESSKPPLLLRTFRGVLLQHLSPSLSSSIFAHLRALNDEIYAWPLRGRRIFDAVHSSDPSVVVLTEYDVHDGPEGGQLPARLDYLGDGVLRSFDGAMQARGFHALLFEGPGRQNAGIGIFARADRFKLPANLARAAAAAAAESGGKADHPVSLKVPSSSFGDLPSPPSPSLAYNIDMQESPSPGFPPFGETERRSFAYCPLYDRLSSSSSSTSSTSSSDRLLVVAAHLMTTSRDKGPYPGSVRAGELETIRKVVAAFGKGESESESDEAEPPAEAGGRSRTLFMGDFNINARGAKSWSVFEGRIRRAAEKDGDGSDEWRFDTGFRRDGPAAEDEGGKDSASCSVDSCGKAASQEPPPPPPPPAEKRIEWEKGDGTTLTLLDAYEGDNERTHDEQGRLVGSSRNAERIEFIDYMFYEKGAFTVRRKSDMTLEKGCIPDENNPSDHLPLIVEFDLL